VALETQLKLGPSFRVDVVSSERSDGNFAVDSAEVAFRRQNLMAGDWTWLWLEHGTDIIPVGAPGDSAGSHGDGAWTMLTDAPLGVTTADCAPVVLAASNGDRAALAVVHAGWKGLLHGIVEVAAATVQGLVGPVAHLSAYCGPCIGPDHYAFSPQDLGRFSKRYGPDVVAATSEGEPSLDLFAGVGIAIERGGFPVPARPTSTAEQRYFSHRVRKDPERMTTVAQLVSL